MKTTLPDHHAAAVKVIETIDSCVTLEQFEGARNLYRAFNRMFKGKWDWVYQDVFYDALNDKYYELTENKNVNLSREIQ